MKINESKFRFRIGDRIIYKEEEHNIVAYYFPSGFNKYTSDYGYVIDSPLHDGGSFSYDEDGMEVTFPNTSVCWVSERKVAPVSPVLTIADRLRYAPSGIELFSPAYGTVKFDKILSSNNIRLINKNNSVNIVLPNGKMNEIDDSECILFPSKDNRDWSTVDYSKPPRKDLPIDTLCFVTEEDYRKDSCLFRYYALESKCYYNGGNTDSNIGKATWGHIVPVDKFDFKNLTFNPEDDYGTKSEYNGKIL
jgi:hypothetical protein